ncbi:MAG: hypothetical protein AAFR47_11600 [Pseudomonadota bacterium]
MAPRLKGGKNIAMKILPHGYQQTITFYRDVPGLDGVGGLSAHAIGFKVAANIPWIDKVAALQRTIVS